MSTDMNLNITESVLEKFTLAQIVKNNFHSASVFEKFNLDFCCNGNKFLDEACLEQGINKGEVLSELENIPNDKDNDQLKFDDWELDFLTDYIVNNHHNYVKNAIPVISAHAKKVAEVHGKNHPAMIKVAEIFSVIYKELKQHLMKEEELLFPHIKYLIKVKNKLSKYERPFFGSVVNPIRMMESEHSSAGSGMAEIRNLTDNYFIPADACNTYMAYMKELKEFEEDLHMHVYLENSILFPKTIELELKLSNL